MPPYKYLALAAYMLTASSLILAGISDARTRMIDDKYWIPAALSVPASILASSSTEPQLVGYMIGAVVGIAIGLATYLGSLTGSADSIAFILISLSTPMPMPWSAYLYVMNIPLVATLINTTIPLLIVAVRLALINVARRGLCGKANASWLITHACVQVSEVRSRPYVYANPHSSLVKVSSDALDYVKGMPDDSWVWVMYNYPYVTILAIAYLIYLFAGNVIFDSLAGIFYSPIMATLT